MKLLNPLPGITGPSKPSFSQASAQLVRAGFTPEQAVLGLILNNHKVDASIRFLRDPENQHLLV